MLCSRIAPVTTSSRVCVVGAGVDFGTVSGIVGETVRVSSMLDSEGKAVFFADGSSGEGARQEQTAPATTAAPQGSDAAAQTEKKSNKTVKDPYKDDIKLAYVAHDIGTPVNQAWLEGIERECAYYDNITVQGFDAKSSAEEQVKIMSEIITQKYDAIILQASDNSALAASVTEAEEAGIPVITINMDVDSVHSALVQMVDYDAGRLAAEEIAKELDGTGKIVIIQGLPGIIRTDNLEKGFRDTISQYSGIEIIGSQAANFEKETAMSVMNSFMQANDKIDGVFAINDAMAEGAALAAESANRLDGMVIWGADGEKDALAMIESGQLTGTIYTNCWDEGSTAAKIALLMIGSEYSYDVLSKTPVINMEPVVVTKDTVGQILPEDRW